MQSIYMSQIFNAPQEEIFEFLSNHNNLGKLLHANITRIKDAEEDNLNGIGSVRSIRMGIEILQETVTDFEAPDYIVYEITSKAPINFHQGRLEFTTLEEGKTQLIYTIDLETKFPFIDNGILFVLKTIISHGLKNLAERYQ